MTVLGEELGLEGIKNALEMFYLTEAPVAELPVAPGGPDDFSAADPRFSAIGQGTYSVSPLQLGLAWASLASQGEIKDVRLVESVQEVDGNWRVMDQTSYGKQIISPESANIVREMLPVHRGITEHSVLVSSGPESGTAAWYLALAPASDPLYAVVVVLEDNDDLSDAEQIGRSLIRNVLNPGDS
jgi:peptidoglycan glycosyltransferase